MADFRGGKQDGKVVADAPIAKEEDTIVVDKTASFGNKLDDAGIK